MNDLPTAQYISERLGDQTIVVDSGGTSNGWSHQTPEGGGMGSSTRSSNRNYNWQQQARRLLTPAEVMALSPRVAITFTPGVPPIWTRLLRYYEEPAFGFGGKKAAQGIPPLKTTGVAALLLVIGAGVALFVSNIAFRQPAPLYVVPNGSVQRQGVYRR